MGSGCFTTHAYASYSTSSGKSYDTTTGFVRGQVYKEKCLNEALNPYKVIRECANSEEHPNTIPVILALDVTGSMGASCKKTAEALGVIMTELYKKFSDIEFMVMGIGDLAYDTSPIQASQFESDVRIAENLDKLYLEFGGGGNAYESYSAAWYFGLHNTKLDCFDKQGRKGIIITLGDEPLNPYLPCAELEEALGCKLQSHIETKQLYEEASKKFDIYHISVDDEDNAYSRYAERIKESFGELLGQRNKVSTLNNLHKTIVECISDSIESGPRLINEGEISW